jgi:TPR repeat protein
VNTSGLAAHRTFCTRPPASLRSALAPTESGKSLGMAPRLTRSRRRNDYASSMLSMRSSGNVRRQPTWALKFMDDREPARLDKLAAEQGNASAQVNLAVLYENGLGGLPKDDREAARLYKLAADQGNALAQVSLGVFYETGRGGLPKNDREAARLYKLAADQGNAAGEAYLGIFYEEGRGGLRKDDREASRLFKLAADQGNVYARAGLKRLAP